MKISRFVCLVTVILLSSCADDPSGPPVAEKRPVELEPFFSAVRILQDSGLSALAVAEDAIDFCDDDFGGDLVLRQNCIDCTLAIVDEVFIE